MEKSIEYEEIVYKFSLDEIRDALIEKYKIQITKDHYFEVFGYYEEPYSAVLSMGHSTKD